MPTEPSEPADPPEQRVANLPGLSVLDASALLALLFQEPGAAAVADFIAQGATVSTLNLSEVAAVLIRNERDVEGILHAVTAQLAVEAFTTADAFAAAALWPPTRATGLSLGDRACLALAQRLGVPAVTADRSWATVNVGIRIHQVRPSRD